MKENTESDDISEKIKVFSSDDEKLKILGELLSNKSSRDIIRLLIEKEMYTNEIAKKLDLRPNLVIHHLQKMESIGLLEITKKKITRKGEEHRFFRIPQCMLIVPNQSDEIKENGFLKKSFKEKIKIIMIPIAGLASWLLTSKTIFVENNWKFPDPHQFSNELLSSLVVSLLVVIVGMLVYLKFKK